MSSNPETALAVTMAAVEDVIERLYRGGRDSLTILQGDPRSIACEIAIAVQRTKSEECNVNSK